VLKTHTSSGKKNKNNAPCVFSNLTGTLKLVFPKADTQADSSPLLFTIISFLRGNSRQPHDGEILLIYVCLYLSSLCKCTVPKIRNKYSQKWNCVASCPISKFVYLWVIYSIYSPDQSAKTQYSKIGEPIVGMYKSLTETWMPKLGTRLRSFISENICILHVLSNKE
jgi:hypothetical protein